jgi:F420-non-reducing hydrogenase iron-sulfur subunit
LGLGEERLRLEWVSAAEGGRFARLIKEFVEDVKKVGPSPLRDGGKGKKAAEIKNAK